MAFFGPVGPNTLETSIAYRVAEILQESPTIEPTSQISPRRMLDNINAAYAWMNRLATPRPNGRLLCYLNAEVINETTGEFDVAWNPFRGDIVAFKVRQGDEAEPTQFNNELAAVRQDCLGNYVNSRWNYGVNQRQGGRLFSQNSTTRFWRIWYLRKPLPLRYGTLVGGTANSLTLDSTPAKFVNLYANETFLTTTADLTTTQYGLCTAYNPTTNVATCMSVGGGVGDAFDPVPTAGDNYSTVPWFDPEFYELLALKAANLFSSLPNASDFAQQIGEASQRYTDWLTHDDLFSAVKPIDMGNSDFGLGTSGYGFYPASGYW